MEGLEILIMKNLIIVLLFSSISMNAQLDTNPFISNTEKITAFSLEGTQWYNVPTSLSSGTTYFQFFSDVIQDYSEFSSGYAPESAKYANKKLYTNIKEYNSTKQRGTLYGYPTYWRLYSLGPEPAQFDFLRIVNQQEGVYDFDLTNYTFDNSLNRDWVVLNGYYRSDGSFAIKESNEKFTNNTPLKIYIDRNKLSFEKIVSPIKIDLNQEIEKYVKQNIFKWQEKGEYEKTSSYNVRVTQKSRQDKVIDYEKEAMIKIGEYLIESLKVNTDKLHLGIENIEVSKYDADNETFIINIKHSDYYIPFIINIPITTAKDFKENLSQAILTNAEFVVIDNKAVLSFANVEFENAIYNYNNKNNYSYVETKINYNFDEIIINSSTSSSNSLNVSTNTISKGKSSVDVNIPENKKVANRYALVIGNQDYTSYQRTLSSEQNVDYAENDATIFKQYCLNTLGVKKENMHFLLNATAGQMSQEIDLVSKIVSKLGPDAELIVYYAGHGYPDELTKVPYLIPVDVSASNLNSAIKLSEVYEKLSSTNAGKISVFLDACFTGGGRTSGLIASRGVKIRPKKGTLTGNMIVFSASSSDQSSLPYHKEAHGMFTFHLLKKLQETKGAISMGALSDYLIDKVSLQSLKENKKEQDPTVNTSQEVSTQWRGWSF